MSSSEDHLDRPSGQEAAAAVRADETPGPQTGSFGFRRTPVHRYPEVLADAVRSGAEIHRISAVNTRDELFARIAASYSFPSWAGSNFDALWDLLCDLSWRAQVPQMLIIGPLDALRAVDPQGADILGEILAELPQNWASSTTPFGVVELVTERIDDRAKV